MVLNGVADIQLCR